MKKQPLILFLLLGLFQLQFSFSQQFNVLVYTSPDRWHDRTVPTAISELNKLAEKHFFQITWGQVDGTANITNVFTDDFLSKVDVVVFLHSRAYDLSPEQKESFKKFIRGGGGFVGIHAASANKEQEPWFQQLIGRVFTLHPEVQTGVLQITDKTHPATLHLPNNWVWTDEMYSFGPALTNNQKVLLNVDEKTYDPDRTWGDDRVTAMGTNHPIAWYQEFDGGRSFYTALGHLPESFKDPLFLSHIYGGIYWAATGLGITK